tara:strand:+ start:275447 stop:276088 length:642 start_codon:yes stop_codon:yes gene_type:complete
MVTALIREKIGAAVRAEARTGHFSKHLQQQLPQLRNKLVLPEDSPVAGLLAFISDYVESVPDCILLVTAVSKHMGFYDYAAPLLDMAEDYFLHPPQALPTDGGLEALLDEAFLAHRLLEEVNDHHIRHLQRPLLPIDMTEANVIVHHLLGDKLANRLDQMVHDTAQKLLEREYVWAKVRAIPASSAAATQLFKYNKVTWSSRRIRLRLASAAS